MVFSVLLAFGMAMVSADECTIAPGETQPNGKPCAATCCREKGNCKYNFETGDCVAAGEDPCLRDDMGEVCLGPCCDGKPAPCEFDGDYRQCVTPETPADGCNIPMGYTLPNGRPCRQECCISVRAQYNTEGCIWNHKEETCSQKPDDACVDDGDDVCLADCCKGRSECSWNKETRQCLTPQD